MAEVLEAIAQGDAGFTRRVAIKRLLARYSDPSFARMFLDEARIAAGLHHSGIVGVLDYGVMDGAPFQILEFIDGENAKELYARGVQSKKPMPIEVALFLVAEVARALHYAHGHADDAGVLRGVVHRDVKPANILVSRAGDVKLTDFGIAFARDRSEQTEVGVAKGTPGYMAPEQIVGGSVDARTDIFALGCTLHALVTAESPLATPGNLERLLRREPLELSSDVPEDVARIVRRATAAVPSARYPTAAAMADDVGVLASQLRADPKGALIKWLESLQPVKAAAPSPFDALLMPEAVLEHDDANDSWHLEMTKTDASALAPTIKAKARPSGLRVVALAVERPRRGCLRRAR